MLCKPCQRPCSTCKSTTECKSCASGYYLLTPENICVDPSLCPNGTYPDTTKGICNKCHSDCVNCLGGNFDECTLCNTTAGYLELTNAYGSCNPLTCSDGYYLNSSIPTCIPCNSKCKTCDEPNTCLECKDGYLAVSLNESVRVNCEGCPLGYMLSKSQECIGNIRRLIK